MIDVGGITVVLLTRSVPAQFICSSQIKGDYRVRISSSSHEPIGNIIAEAMNKVGKEGVITVEETKAMVAEKSKKETLHPPMPGGGGMEGMY